MTRLLPWSLVTIAGRRGCLIMIGYYHVIRLWAGLEYLVLLQQFLCVLPELKYPVLTISCPKHISVTPPLVGARLSRAKDQTRARKSRGRKPLHHIRAQGISLDTSSTTSKTRQLPIIHIRWRRRKASIAPKISLYSAQWAPERVPS